MKYSKPRPTVVMTALPAANLQRSTTDQENVLGKVELRCIPVFLGRFTVFVLTVFTHDHLCGHRGRLSQQLDGAQRKLGTGLKGCQRSADRLSNEALLFRERRCARFWQRDPRAVVRTSLIGSIDQSLYS